MGSVNRPLSPAGGRLDTAFISAVPARWKAGMGSAGIRKNSRLGTPFRLFLLTFPRSAAVMFTPWQLTAGYSRSSKPEEESCSSVRTITEALPASMVDLDLQQASQHRRKGCSRMGVEPTFLRVPTFT